jgi:hypothetical protein
MLAYAGIGLALYVGGYVALMCRDVASVEDGKYAYRSSFWFAPSVRVEGPLTIYGPAVSPLNVVFEPVDYCWRRICGFISAIPENEPFAEGQLDPGRIKEIWVFLNPPGMFMAERYEDLRRCRRVEVATNGAAQELCQALSARHSVLDKDGGGTTVDGTIEAVIDGGKSVFLYFYVIENGDVYVCHPVSPSRAPQANGHGQNTLLPWLRKYVLQGEVK